MSGVVLACCEDACLCCLACGTVVTRHTTESGGWCLKGLRADDECVCRCSRQHGYSYKFNLTAHELELVFLGMPACLVGLITQEVEALNASASSSSDARRAPCAVDPTAGIIAVCAQVLAWYMSTKMQALSCSQIRDLHCEAGRILENLERTFPRRSTGVPAKPGRKRKRPDSPSGVGGGGADTAGSHGDGESEEDWLASPLTSEDEDACAGGGRTRQRGGKQVHEDRRARGVTGDGGAGKAQDLDDEEAAGDCDVRAAAGALPQLTQEIASEFGTARGVACGKRKAEAALHDADARGGAGRPREARDTDGAGTPTSSRLKRKSNDIASDRGQADEGDGDEGAREDEGVDYYDAPRPGERPLKRPCWGFPKGHAMLHVQETHLLYGNIAEVSAEPMERLHLLLKKLYAKVEDGPLAAKQVLLAVMKAETAARLKETAFDSDEGEDTHDGDALGRMTVNASFSQGLHPSGRLFPVCQAIREWKQCEGELVHRAGCAWEASSKGRAGRRAFILELNELHEKTSPWCKQVPDLNTLPVHLARYIRDHLDHLPDGIPGAGGPMLTWQNIQTLLKMVMPYAEPGSAGRPTVSCNGHLSIYNALRIRHPKMPGQVPALVYCPWHIHMTDIH